MTTEPTAKKNRMATLALVLAICGLVLPFVFFSVLMARDWITSMHDSRKGVDMDVVDVICLGGAYFVPPIFGFVSVVLAYISRHQIKKAPSTTGKSATEAALIVGYLTIALWFGFAFLHNP